LKRRCEREGENKRNEGGEEREEREGEEGQSLWLEEAEQLADGHQAGEGEEQRGKEEDGTTRVEHDAMRWEQQLDIR
jgi:hypothetical protein